MIHEKTRKCRKCNKEKLIEDFKDRKDVKSGKRWICKDCAHEMHVSWTQKNKNFYEERVKIKEKKCPCCNLTKRSEDFPICKSFKSGLHSHCKLCIRLKSAGITSEVFYEIYNKQNKKCSICGLAFERSIGDKTNSPHIDHNHKNGKIRGILCHKCNSAIGLFNDNLELLQRAIEYLEENE